MFTYLIIFLIVIVPYVKIKKRITLLSLKYDFLFYLHNPKCSENDLLSLKNKYPYFFDVIKKIYGVSKLDVSFEEIARNSKTADKEIQKELDKEFKAIFKNGNKKEKNILRWYILLNFNFYLYKNPYKYMFLKLTSRILPKKQYKKIEEKEKIKQPDLCMV